jgi:hypothetical protein
VTAACDGLTAAQTASSPPGLTLVSLTAEGRAIYKRVQNIWGDLERVTVAGLTPAEVQQLERLVRHVLSNLQNGQDTPPPC